MQEYANTLPTELNQCELFITQTCQEIDRLTVLRDNLVDSFTINVLGVHWVTRAFLPLLQKGTQKKVANM